MESVSIFWRCLAAVGWGVGAGHSGLLGGPGVVGEYLGQGLCGISFYFLAMSCCYWRGESGLGYIIPWSVEIFLIFPNFVSLKLIKAMRAYHYHYCISLVVKDSKISKSPRIL